MPLRDADSITWKSSVNDCSTHAYLPVLDFKPLVQPPAEKQWLCRNFLYVHTLEVYVDPRTFFAQEFCQTQKNKETKQKQEKPFSKAARREGTYDNHGVSARALRCWDAHAKN